MRREGHRGMEWWGWRSPSCPELEFESCCLVVVVVVGCLVVGVVGLLLSDF